MTTDRHVADAARAYVAAQTALEGDVDYRAASTLDAVIVRDLAWYLLVQLCTADNDETVNTPPL